MALHISLKKKNNAHTYYSRFKSAIHLFNDFFKQFHLDGTIAFFVDEPIKNVNNDFKRIKLDSGALETDFFSKIKKMGSKAIRAGFEIEANIRLNNKDFELIFELIPANRNQFYDIHIDILSNQYAETIEDLKTIDSKFGKNIIERVKYYNEQIEVLHQYNGLFSIRKLVMCEDGYEFHGIDKWELFYTKNPSEIINHLSYGHSNLRKRLIIGNIDKFSDVINQSTNYLLKMDEFAQESRVAVESGSIAFIPSSAESMKHFTDKLRKLVTKAAKSVYVLEEDYKKKIESAINN